MHGLKPRSSSPSSNLGHQSGVPPRVTAPLGREARAQVPAHVSMACSGLEAVQPRIVVVGATTLVAVHHGILRDMQGISEGMLGGMPRRGGTILTGLAS